MPLPFTVLTRRMCRRNAILGIVIGISLCVANVYFSTAGRVMEPVASFSPHHNEIREQISVTTVCMMTEAQTVKELGSLIKSLMLTSVSSPVLLVILSDQECETQIREMVGPFWNNHSLLTLDVRQVNDILSHSNHSGNIITTQHHSGVGGLCFSFLDVLLPDLNRTISVNTDVTFFSDVALLWEEFDRFSPETLFGHAINDPPHRAGTGYSWTRWNAGLVLKDLERFRQLPGRREGTFFKTLLDRGRQKIPNLKFIADQHWINYLCWETPSKCLIIPFNWNVQICAVEGFDAMGKGAPIYFPDGKKWIGAIHENCVKPDNRKHSLLNYLTWLESVEWSNAVSTPPGLYHKRCSGAQGWK